MLLKFWKEYIHIYSPCIYVINKKYQLYVKLHNERCANNLLRLNWLDQATISYLQSHQNFCRFFTSPQKGYCTFWMPSIVDIMQRKIHILQYNSSYMKVDELLQYVKCYCLLYPIRHQIYTSSLLNIYLKCNSKLWMVRFWKTQRILYIKYEIPYLVQLENYYLLMLVTNTFVKKIHHQVTQLWKHFCIFV